MVLYQVGWQVTTDLTFKVYPYPTTLLFNHGSKDCSWRKTLRATCCLPLSTTSSEPRRPGPKGAPTRSAPPWLPPLAPLNLHASAAAMLAARDPLEPSRSDYPLLCQALNLKPTVKVKEKTAASDPPSEEKLHSALNYAQILPRAQLTTGARPQI